MKGATNQGQNVSASQLPLWRWGDGNVYLLVLSSRKVTIAKKPHCRNGVVDTFEHRIAVISGKLRSLLNQCFDIVPTVNSCMG